ncbi:MAG: hypothetical protein H0U53_11065 [Actinobacteria bacterium]|nr:hypothetical protein [Actinomycetota bacterium]
MNHTARLDTLTKRAARVRSNLQDAERRHRMCQYPAVAEAIALDCETLAQQLFWIEDEYDNLLFQSRWH